MNPVILFFADGTVFFIGLAVTLVAGLLMFRFCKGRLRPVLMMSAVVGVILVAISSTPLPIWLYIAWFVSLLAVLTISGSAKTTAKLRTFGMTAFVLATVILCCVEVPYRCMPGMKVPAGKKIFVLGDSISAGMGTDDRCWPEALKEEYGFSVVNLAMPGATIKSAFEQAEGIDQPGSVVIVEIGGNDMFGGIKATDFQDQLNQLISSLHTDGHQILMVELPLYPFKNNIGASQRSIAARYNASLLPKRCLTRVLAGQEATLDGLHLSEKGHNVMADIIAQVFK